MPTDFNLFLGNKEVFQNQLIFWGLGCEGIAQYCSDSTQKYIDLLTHDYCVRKPVENYTLTPFLETCIQNKELQMRNYITQVEQRKGKRHIEVIGKIVNCSLLPQYHEAHGKDKLLFFRVLQWKKKKRKRGIIFNIDPDIKST